MQKKYWSVISAFSLLLAASLVITLIRIILFDYILKISYNNSLELFDIAKTLDLFLYWVVIFLLIRIKKTSFSEYLNLKSVSFSTIIKWIGITLLFLMMLSIVSWILTGKVLATKNPFISHFSWRLVIIDAIFSIIIAPASEEMIWRGFLFKSIEHSKLGKIGAILITAFLFMLIHVDISLNVFKLGLWIGVLPVGLLCGIARAKTQSIFIGMGIHAIYNSYLTLYDIIQAISYHK